MSFDLLTSLQSQSTKATTTTPQQKKTCCLPPRPSFAQQQQQQQQQHHYFDRDQHSPATCSEGSRQSSPSPSPSLSLTEHCDTLQVQPTPAPPQPPLTLTSFFPFPRQSVNLISCCSNSGKTFFLEQIIHHREIFFQSPELTSRIVFVNCNQRDLSIQHPWSTERNDGVNEDDNDNQQENSTIDLEVVSLTLEDFADFTTILQPNDILILDDVLQINEDIQFIVKYGCHHYSLAAVFVVTQSCLSSPLYSLIGACHNLILLFGNTATTRLAQHLVQAFFLCPDTKAYLKAIFGIAEKQQDTVVLKLNSIASNRLHSRILALTRVQGLFAANCSDQHSSPPFCFVYPELNHWEHLSQTMSNSIMGDLSLEDGGPHLKEAFVLLPASRVRQQDLGEHSEGSGKLCANEKQKKWNEMALYLEHEIESTFPLKKWNAAKNLTREILRCNELCISTDFRSVFISNKPRSSYAIIDFLHAAIRKSGPNELPEKVAMYRPLVQVLLKHNVPHAFILNKLMLPGQKQHSTAAARAARRGSHHHYDPAQSHEYGQQSRRRQRHRPFKHARRIRHSDMYY